MIPDIGIPFVKYEGPSSGAGKEASTDVDYFLVRVPSKMIDVHAGEVAQDMLDSRPSLVGDAGGKSKPHVAAASQEPASGGKPAVSTSTSPSTPLTGRAGKTWTDAEDKYLLQNMKDIVALKSGRKPEKKLR